MTDLFPSALIIVFPEEGPYSNASGDPGGETKWGVARNEHPEITDAQWAAWTRQDSVDLLRAKYWDAADCGSMPWPWALGVFDGEVNQGSVIRLAQVALGVRADGAVGPATLAAMASSSDWQFCSFMAARAWAYVGYRDFPRFGRGWFERIHNVTLWAAREPPQPKGASDA